MNLPTEDTEYAVGLAQRVLEGIVDLSLKLGIDAKELEVEIWTHHNDLIRMGSNPNEEGMLWGKRVTRSTDADEGHPHLMLTVVL